MSTWFRTNPFFTGNVEKVNYETGEIKDVAIITMGEAKGHGMMIDATVLKQVADYGNSLSKGVKMRFGHPNMCGTALGTFIGRATNFRVVEDKVIGDVKLSETAKNAPSGDLFTYVLDMASKEDDMFGTSIAFTRDLKLEEEYNSNNIDDDNFYVRLSKLLAVDVVDEPAANEGGLFSTDTIAGQVTQFLDENPDIFKILSKKPEIVEGFLARYNKNKEKEMEKDDNKQVADVQENAVVSKDAKAEFAKIEEAFGEKIAVKSLKEELSLEQAQELFLAEIKEQNEALLSQVAELKEQLSAKIDGDAGVEFSEGEEAELSEVEKAKLEKFEKLKQNMPENIARFASSLNI